MLVVVEPVAQLARQVVEETNMKGKSVKLANKRIPCLEVILSQVAKDSYLSKEMMMIALVFLHLACFIL